MRATVAMSSLRPSSKVSRIAALGPGAGEEGRTLVSPRSSSPGARPGATGLYWAGLCWTRLCWAGAANAGPAWAAAGGANDAGVVAAGAVAAAGGANDAGAVDAAGGAKGFAASAGRLAP